MSKICYQTIILLVSCVIGLASEDSTSTDKRAIEGFHGYTWGTPLDEFDTLLIGEELVMMGGSDRWYSTSIDTFATAEVLCYFVFYKGEFSAVRLWTEGSINAKSLVGGLEAKYGKPKKAMLEATIIWDTKQTYGTYKMNNEGTGQLDWWSKKHLRGMDSDIEEVERKPVQDSFDLEKAEDDF